MKNKNQIALAVALIGFGVLLLLSKFISLPEYLFSIAIGIVFLIVYYKSGESYVNRKLWALIVGDMVIATSLSGWIEESQLYNWLDSHTLFDMDGMIFFVLIGLGFLLIDQIHLKHYNPKGKSWALIVGVVCIIFGVFTAVVDMFGYIVDLLPWDVLWPIALIGAGLVILYQSSRSKTN